MSENRRQILEMLSNGKINAVEAENLLRAVERETSSAPNSSAENPVRTKAKYLRILVESDERGGSPTKVNVRVPLQLLRAGVKLASVIPVQARAQVNKALRENGVDVDLTQLKPEHLEELIENINELTVDVDDGARNKVRIFCE